ncbi:hypothetical protein HNQ60_002274 [Povalibacter uvarum]|uniref:DUF3261 domain-containing protein n=1 Tax=Povalibacter uvarum TaxID=732238 RepID=A0A841HKM5_9GAMM|nr:DUF3261 domain-containing protein [Povalibacter uvarum]MBB6093396.1 hypothetical protein [Povalibacter uvarum]
MKWVAVLSLLLAGCAGAPQSQRTATPERPLVAPSALGAERSVNQVVRGAIGSREMTLNCVVTVKDGQMTVVGLSAMGVRLFTIHYDGRDVQSEQSLPTPEQLTPRRLLADLQFVFWPAAALQQPLKQQGWDVSDSSGTRRLRRDGNLVAEAHYGGDDPWSGRSWLVNLEYGYSLQIDSKAL